MNDFITQSSFKEYQDGMERWNKRQDERLKAHSEKLDDLEKMNISLVELATSVKTMCDELKSQGKRLDELEDRDGEMWRKVSGYVITTIVGIVIGYIFMQIGME